jgi:Cu-processing system permease protein
MKGVLLVAGKESREGIRNRWVAAATLLLAALAPTLAFLGATPAGRPTLARRHRGGRRIAARCC